MSVFEIIAAHSGTCPLCARYVVAGRSRIAALPCPFPPNPEHTYYARGCWYLGGAEGHVRPRLWAHADCLTSILKRHDISALFDVADDWRADLKDRKRQADRDEGRPRSRRPQQVKPARTRVEST